MNPYRQPLYCPVCHKILQFLSIDKTVGYASCREHGDFIGLDFIAQLPNTKDFLQGLLHEQQRPILNGPDKSIKCPRCRKIMTTTLMNANTLTRVDQCLTCRSVWFDCGELGAAQGKGGLDKIFPSIDFENAFRPNDKKPWGWPSNSQDITVQKPHIMDYLLPLNESPTIGHATNPVATVLLILGCVATTMISMKFTPGFHLRHMFYPLDAFQNFGMNLFSSLFLHAGWLHLLGNMYFLWMTGDDVENAHGPGFLLLLFFFAGIGGHVLYKSMGGTIPSLGASGSISGVMAYYALAFPNKRLRYTRISRFGYRFYTMTMEMPAPVYFAVFIFLESLSAAKQSLNFGGGVNHWAHLGGALVGAILYFSKRK